MKRKALADLQKWMNNPNRKPLIVWGSRQVGKSYLIKEIFAKQFFPDKYVYIDFRLEKDINAFCFDNVDPKQIMTFISLIKNTNIDENTLLIFDEIQECPAIITSLKYFCQNFRKQPVIATGSMVRTKLKRIVNKRGKGYVQEFLFPVGKINQLNLYPMNFEEFLMNYNENLLNTLKETWNEKKALSNELHQLALETLNKYLLIGGMPEAVAVFIENEDYYESREVLKNLYDNYLSDMELYQASTEAVVRSRKIFKNIYSELNKESKNFKCNLIEEHSKIRDFKNPLEWLNFAKIVHQSFQLKEKVTLPLMQNNDSNFRLYLSDIGMFCYQSGINPTTFIDKRKQNTLSGIFYENYIATEMACVDLPLFYWKGKNSSELEFITENNGQILVIDVKRGRNSLNSLKKFRDLNKKQLAVKISENNFGYDKEQKLLTVPLYQAFMLFHDISRGNLPEMF